MPEVRLYQLRPGSEIGVDARDGSDVSVETIKHTILQKGILQPLRVVWRNRPGETERAIFVVAGNRRLRAMKELAAEGKIPEDYVVEISEESRDATDAELLETSVIENLERLPQHPVEIYRTFAKIADAGKSEKEIAATFGIKPKEVRQRLALGRIAAPILDAWRQGLIGADSAQAFTLTDDQDEQIRVFEAQQKVGRLYAWEIKKALTHGAEDLSREIRLVGGVSAAKKGGVEFTEDLFGEGKFVKNPDVLQAMVRAMFDARIADAVADGWKWAAWVRDMPKGYYSRKQLEPEPDFTEAESSRLAEIDAILTKRYDWNADQEKDQIEKAATFRSFPADLKAKSGVLFSINREDVIVIHSFGLVRPEDDEANPEPPAEGANAAAAETADPFKPLSPEPKAVIDKLRQAKTDAIARTVAMSTNRVVSILLVAAMLARGAGSPILLSARGGVSSDVDELFTAPSDLSGFPAVLEWVSGLDDWQLSEAIASLLAGCVDARSSAMYDPMTGNHKGVSFAGIDAVMTLLDPEVLNGFMQKAFDADAYFAGAKKSQILDAIGEALGDDVKKQWSKAKAPDITFFAVHNVPPTGWLPVELRTHGYVAPTPGQAHD